MFYFIHVQGQNALTTLLHLADEFWSQNVPLILNNILNLKCQFYYLPQRTSLARIGSQMFKLLKGH